MAARRPVSGRVRTDRDFDQAARDLFKQLDAEERVRRKGEKKDLYKYRSLNAVWTHRASPSSTGDASAEEASAGMLGGGTVYVGNRSAAQDRKLLEQHNITRVVNCQDSSTQNYFEDESDERRGSKAPIRYFRFRISTWIMEDGVDTPAGIMEYCRSYLEWVDNAIARGESVLVHCLAGAHRAGTAGTLYVMHAGGYGYADALAITKKRRPVIDPIGHLGQFLARFENARRELAAVKADDDAGEEERSQSSSSSSKEE